MLSAGEPSPFVLISRENLMLAAKLRSILKTAAEDGTATPDELEARALSAEVAWLDQWAHRQERYAIAEQRIAQYEDQIAQLRRQLEQKVRSQCSV
jgi:hypothetical protein